MGLRHTRLGETLSYVLVILWLVSAGVARPGTLIGGGVDLYGTMWFFDWIRECVSTGQNPGFTDQMFFPFGKDIFAHTGGNFVDALLSVPLQHLFGYPDFYPWFVVLLLGANVASFRLLVGGLVKHRVVAWLSSILWLTNPFVLGELQGGRPTQALLCFMPLAVYFFLRCGERWQAAILAGLCTALQAWTYWFSGWFMAFIFVVIAVQKICRGTLNLPRHLVHWSMAGVTCLALVSPAWMAMASKVQAGLVPGVGITDLGALHGWRPFAEKGTALFGTTSWILLGLVTMLMRPSRSLWGLVLLGSMLLAFGPTSDGFLLWQSVYQAVVGAVPFLERLWFPYRWLSVSFFAVCIGTALVLDTLVARTSRWASWAAALVALALVEQAMAGRAPLRAQQVNVPVVYQAMGHQQGGIIEIPFAVIRESLLWQPLHKQPLFGGMGENAPAFWPPGFRHRMEDPFVRFLRGATHPGATAQPVDESALKDIQSKGFRFVVLDADALMRKVAKSPWWAENHMKRGQVAEESVSTLVSALGEPAAVDGPLVVWDLQGEGFESAELQPPNRPFVGQPWTGLPWSAYEKELELYRME